jgi:predicted dehydrogenase
MIASGKAGRPTLFDARYACNSVHGPWWRDKKKSGGQTLEQIIHLYDMAMLMLGKPVRVSGFAANLCHKDVPGYTVEDTSAFSILFKEGGMANISGTNNAVPMKWVNPFTVVCEKLTAFFESPNQAEFVFTADGKAESVVVSGNVNMYQEEAKAFIRVLRGEIENPAPLEQGLLGLKTAAAALESARLKGEVQIIR